MEIAKRFMADELAKVITMRGGTKWCQRYRRMSKRRRKKALYLETVCGLNCLIGQPFNQDTHDQAVTIVNDILDNVIRPYTITLATLPRR